MKISISGSGIHRREVPGIEKLRNLPPNWYAFTNLELVDAGKMPRQIDVVLVLDDRMLIVDLKDWSGRITSDGDRWFQNDRAVDTSPVKKILENARIMAGLLGRFLTKASTGRGRKFNRWELPLIEGCVVVTGRCDIRGLPDMEKVRVFQIDDFCKFLQDPRERSQRLATPPWIDKVEPYTSPSSKWRSDLARFFGSSEGYFKPLDKMYGEYKAISEYTYQHPKQIYREYDAEEVSLSHGFGLLRLWDFSQAEPRYASEEARAEIAGREQNVITYLLDRQPDLEAVLIRPKSADPDKGVHYWEVFERRRQLRRLGDFLTSNSEELTTAMRIDLARTLISHVAAMHRVGAAHLDIGEHSVWMELPSIIRISHLVAASYQELASLGAKRFEFLASGTVLPESIIEQEEDHYRKDVFLLGVAVHSIIFGKPPTVSAPGEPPAWNSEVDATDGLSHLHGWFERSLDVASASRFANAQEALDSFNAFACQSDRGPNAIERLLRFRRWKSVRELYKQYPDELVLKETDRMIVWTSTVHGRTLLIKTWRRACWGDERLEAPRLAKFCETAEDLILSEQAGVAKIIDVGYLGDHLVLIQEHVDAKNLETTIAQDLPEWLDSIFVARFLISLTKTIIDLHESGFTHGDLKPSNILVVTDGASVLALLVDVLDFGPLSEGEIRTAAYAPTHDVGTKERDRYAVLQIAEELFARSVLSSGTADLLASALQTGRTTEPILSTLEPLLEALEEIETPSVPDLVPEIKFSFPGLEPGILLSDEGQFYVWLQKPYQFTITGSSEEVTVFLNRSGNRAVVDVKRKTLSQSLISLAEKRCNMRLVARIEVLNQGRDTQALAGLIDTLLPEAASSATSRAESESIAPSNTPQTIELDEDVIVEDSYPASTSTSFDVPAIWRTLLQVEEEQMTRGVTEFDSSFSRQRRRHTVVLQIRSGILDFTREDRVLVELSTKNKTWVPIGILDLDLTKGKEVAVDASTFRARDGALLCPAGSDLRFRSMMETDSRMRRTAATNRILRRGCVSPNLIDYLGWAPPEPAVSHLVVDRGVVGERYGLNESQVDAFVNIISNRPLGLLQGPPGTGKTKFIASLVHYLLSSGIISNVLLASQSHEAVNNATEGVLRLFRKSDVEPSLVRVGQEGSISEVLKPYHSAKVEAHYREKFRAGLKQRFEVASQQIGLPKAFAQALFIMESTVWPVFKRFQLARTNNEAGEDPQARIISLQQTLLNLQQSLDLEHDVDLDWENENAYDDAISLLVKKHSIHSAEQVRKLRGVANLARDWMGSVTNRRRSFEEFLANTRQIVSGTCVGLGRAQLGLASGRFDLVIVDEAARCTASELAVPIQAGKWVLLVGDHLQLEPFHDPAILRESQRRLEIPMKEIVRSDFERSFASTYGGATGQTLKTQYRMLPIIGRLVSDVFYKGTLKHGRNTPAAPEHIWPTAMQRQITWISTDGLGSRAYQSPRSEVNRSLSNSAEANAIADVLRGLDDHAPFIEWLVSLSSDEQPIGIICTYAAQCQVIRQRLRAVGLSQTLLNACKIDTVDSYQGKENLLVILSLVRNNEDGVSGKELKAIAPGFMSRANRMNVALSRAMDKLVIVGALNRWPVDGTMEKISSAFQSLYKEEEASLVELSPSDTDSAPTVRPKTKRNKTKRAKGVITNG